MGFLKRLMGSSGDDPESQLTRDAETGGLSDESLLDSGIFSGLFLARPGDVDAWDFDGLTPAEWPAVEFKWLEIVKLGTLEAILTGRSYHDIDDEHTYVFSGREAGPLVARVRDELIAALAGLPRDQIQATAEAWADTDEFKLPGAHLSDSDVEDLADLLAAMQVLASRSRDSSTPMYLLMSV
jgi:hypothetical protein